MNGDRAVEEVAALRVARRRCGDMYLHQMHLGLASTLMELLAEAYLLGVRDAADVIDKERSVST